MKYGDFVSNTPPRDKAHKSDQTIAVDAPFTQFVESEVYLRASELDADAGQVDVVVQKLLKVLASTRSPAPSSESPLIITNSELKELFSGSTALAFKIAQHFTVVEGLSNALEWQRHNHRLWTEISRADRLVGLATTQQMRADSRKLHAVETPFGFEVSGSVPWVAGHGLFSHLLLRFATETENIAAVVEFPNSELKHFKNQFRLTPYRLQALNSTASVQIEFDKLPVDSKQVVARTLRSSPPLFKLSRFRFPEIGIAKRALHVCRLIVNQSEHPRHQFVAERLGGLEMQIQRIEDVMSSDPSPEDFLRFSVLKDQVIHKAVRLLILTQGASALAYQSVASRLQMESMLFDVILQAPPALFEKIEQLTNDSI